jgi:hypothetical protein
MSARSVSTLALPSLSSTGWQWRAPLRWRAIG